VSALLAPLVSGLRAALGEDAPTSAPVKAAAPIDPARLRSVVEEMRGYLAESDSAAVDFLEGNRDVFSALLPATEFDRFEQHVQAFSFPEALAQLQQLAPAAIAES